MIGDLEKLLKRGDKVKMNVMGQPFELEVLATDVSEYERKYLVSFSNAPNDTKWITNTIVRQFSVSN